MSSSKCHGRALKSTSCLVGATPRVRVCVRERERQGHISAHQLNHSLCVCVYEWERERERDGHIKAECTAHQTACLQTHTSLITDSDSLLPSRAWTDGKTKDTINCLYIHFESWSSRLWKEALHFRRGLWYSANHNALCQLANQSRLCLSEGGTL